MGLPRADNEALSIEDVVEEAYPPPPLSRLQLLAVVPPLLLEAWVGVHAPVQGLWGGGGGEGRGGEGRGGEGRGGEGRGGEGRGGEGRGGEGRGGEGRGGEGRRGEGRSVLKHARVLSHSLPHYAAKRWKYCVFHFLWAG